MVFNFQVGFAVKTGEDGEDLGDLKVSFTLKGILEGDLDGRRWKLL